MAKNKKRKQFRDFESSAWQDEFKETYISITKSMMTNEKWLNMEYSARELYLYMKLWARGKKEFDFSYSLALNVIGSTRTIQKRIYELVNNGFIEIIKCSKRPGIGTVYKFSDNWYTK